MATTANEIYYLLIQKLQQSQLNFHLTETPYSAQILIRKRFLKDKTCPISLFFPAETKCQNDEIKKTADDSVIIELQKTVQNSNEIIDLLENKVARAEAQALKLFEEKKTDISSLKNALKKSDDENKNLKKVIGDIQKVAKEKERAALK